MMNEQSEKESALKGQPVPRSPGQRPGYQRANAYALGAKGRAQNRFLADCFLSPYQNMGQVKWRSYIETIVLF